MNIRERIAVLRTDLKYSLKLLRGVASGYDGLQYQFDGPWLYVPERVGWVRDEYGNYKSESQWLDFPDQPYYVCALWKDGSHTPLPIILGCQDDGAPSVQQFVVAVLESLAFRWHRAVSFGAAFEDCARYEHSFAEEERKRRERDGCINSER